MIEFFAMGGHGPYIWSAYGASLVGLAGLYLVRSAKLRNAERNARKHAKQDAEKREE